MSAKPKAASSFQSRVCVHLSGLAREDIINKRINIRNLLLEQLFN